MRPQALHTLLKSVSKQSLYPDEILIIDGSANTETEQLLQAVSFKHLKYFNVFEANRGLTKQRNYGISRVAASSKVVCFLDDDTVLEQDYFYNLIKIFKTNNTVTGVGGIATNENKWKINTKDYYNSKKYLNIDGYHLKLGQRHIVRNYLGLGSDCLPGIMPESSNGLSSGYPLIGKYYEVDLLIGMSMSFRKKVVETIKFSHYFEGYGLYEDADFSIRALQFGKNVLATNVLLQHHHNAAGRPNQYTYGKMVVRNGWYVWRVKYAKPSFKARYKWHATVLLLIGIRFLNVFTTSQRKEAFTESCGRVVGWLSLFVNSPKAK